MSKVTETGFELVHVNICNHGYVEEESELAEFVESVQDLGYPDQLPNRDIYIDPSGLNEFEITLSNAALSFPQNYKHSTFYSDLNSKESYVHIHSNIQKELIDELIDFHTSVASFFEEVSFGPLSFTFSGEPVEEFPTVSGSLPKLRDENHKIDSFRFEADEGQYSFRLSDDETLVAYNLEEIGDVATTDITDEVQEQLEAAKDDLS